MAKRRPVLVFFVVLGSVLLVIIGLGYFKYAQISAAIAQGKSFRMPPQAVTTTIVSEDTWQPTLSTVGSLTAVNGVMVSADLPGIIEKISFESGKPVKEGDVLLQLDIRQELAQAEAAEAKLQLATQSLHRQTDLLNKRVSSQSDYDSASAEYQQAKAVLQEIRATIDRKTIRAPFSGNLGIRLVNVGQYLQSGDKIVPLQSLDPIYVDFALPQQHLSELKPGTPVRIQAEGTGTAVYTGEITAINSLIDSSSRNIQLQATLKNPDGTLLPGMFVKVEVLLPKEEKILSVPASAISYAPYGDSVYVVESSTDPDGKPNKIVKQQFVVLGASRGDQVAVVSGLQPGQEVVTSGAFKLRPDAEVKVNNEVQPSNESAPTPVDS